MDEAIAKPLELSEKITALVASFVTKHVGMEVFECTGVRLSFFDLNTPISWKLILV